MVSGVPRLVQTTPTSLATPKSPVPVLSAISQLSGSPARNRLTFHGIALHPEPQPHFDRQQTALDRFDD